MNCERVHKRKRMETLETGFSLGSNLGDRLANLRNARAALCNMPGLNMILQASVYETMPFDVPAEYECLFFLNTILIFEAEQPQMNAHSLLAAVKEIEKKMGRTKSKTRNSPRIIDIDILYMGSTSIASPVLSIPHREWSNRRFILEPLAEIRSWLLIPGADKTVSEMLKTLDDPGKAVKVEAGNW